MYLKGLFSCMLWCNLSSGSLKLLGLVETLKEVWSVRGDHCTRFTGRDLCSYGKPKMAWWCHPTISLSASDSSGHMAFCLHHLHMEITYEIQPSRGGQEEARQGPDHEELHACLSWWNLIEKLGSKTEELSFVVVLRIACNCSQPVYVIKVKSS